MKISVLINNYNYAHYLAACIDSVASQNYQDFEIIVVDDGSTDNSAELIKSYSDRIIPVMKENGGQASSFNAGFAASSGEVVCLLDADDSFLPGKLAAISKIYADEKPDWCFDYVTTDESSVIAPNLDLQPVDKRAELGRGRFPSLAVPTSGLTFHRNLLSKILPMPTARDVVLSDNYLKFAAAYLGHGIVVKTPLTYQRIHGANRYTGADKSRPLQSRIMVQTGLELARRYKGLSALGKSLIAGGLAQSGFSTLTMLSEVRRCTRDGTFGPMGAVSLPILVILKKLFSKRTR